MYNSWSNKSISVQAYSRHYNTEVKGGTTGVAITIADLPEVFSCAINKTAEMAGINILGVIPRDANVVLI